MAINKTTLYSTGLGESVSEGKGGLLVNGSVIYVDTIADLQALPTSGLVDGQASIVQGSEFQWNGLAWMGKGKVSVKAYGAVGDGIADDTQAIQSAVESHGHTFIPDGTYLVDVDTGINIPSDRIIEFSAQGVLKAKPTDSGNHRIFQLVNVDNVTFLGAKLFGERDDHTGTTGGAGLGIRILSSSNVTISGGWARKFWGDGLYIGAFDAVNHVECENILVENFESYENRRQGASITGIDGLTIRNCIFRGTSGTAPESGIDVEPNGSFSCTNLFIENCKFLNNAGGGLELANINAGAVDNVYVDSCRMSGNYKSGIRTNNATNIYITNCISTNNPDRGIYAIDSSTLNVNGGVYSNNGADGIRATTGTDINVNSVTASGNSESGINIRDSGIVRNSIARGNSGRGIIVGSNSIGVNVDNCIVEDNGATGVYALGKIFITGCTVKANATAGSSSNIEIYADDCYVSGTLVRVGDNANKPDYGLRSTSNSGLTVINNDFRNSGASSNIERSALTGEVLEDNFPYKRRGEFADRPTENLYGGQFYYSTLAPNNEPLWYTFGGTWVDRDGTTYP